MKLPFIQRSKFSWQLTMRLASLALAMLIVSAMPSTQAQDTQTTKASNPTESLAPAEYWKIRSPHAGDAAPPLALTTIYDRPASIPDPTSFSWKDYRGRVVIIEFSASWCAPCIALIPHMNELVTEFKDQPVTFITVSNESDEDIAKFRTKHPMKSLFGRDTNNATHKNYWVSAVPMVAIVNAEGKVAAITHPNRVTKDVIRDVLAGKPVTLPTMPTRGDTVSVDGNHPSQEKSSGGTTPPTNGATATLSEAEKVPFMRSEVNKRTGEMRLTGSPRDLVMYAYDAAPHLLDYKAPLPSDHSYQAYIKPLDGKLETAKKMLRQLLETNLSLKVTTEPRSIKGKLLRRVPGGPSLPESKDEISRSSYQGGVFSARNAQISSLVNFLSRTFSQTVIDETGLKNKYDIEFTWDVKGGNAALLESLKKLGFELVDGEAKVDYLTVTEVK